VAVSAVLCCSDDGLLMRLLQVLVVDDDYRVAGIHAAYLERTDGFAVLGQAHTAVQALELAARLHPDLVLMDLHLPDGNGLDVVRALLESPKPPDVIIISAARELDAVRASIQLGVLHYLVKPFGYQVLAEQLAAYQRLRLHSTPS
jgi:response regulator of citrate/malate metabolism